MRDVFISHAEEDARIAGAIAAGLQSVGFTTWSYEDDSDVGFSYLSQIDQEIEETQVLILIISRHSLDSDQVTKEIVRAHEARKPVLPVRHGLSHDEVQRRREWRMALGAAVSMQVPPEGIPALMPRLLKGLDRLGVVPSGTPSGEMPAVRTEETRGAAGAYATPASPPRAVPPPRPAFHSTPEGTASGDSTLLDGLFAGAKPGTAFAIAAVVGGVGVLWNLMRFFQALFPGDGRDDWQMRVFPWLQVGFMLLGFVGVVLNGLLLFGAWQTRQGQREGARILRLSSLAILVVTGLWFVVALITMMGSDRWEQIPDQARASVVAGLLGSTLVASVLATLVFAMARRR